MHWLDGACSYDQPWISDVPREVEKLAELSRDGLSPTGLAPLESVSMFELSPKFAC